MNTLFIGKRYYTNRDALLERYGRIYQLPALWRQDGVDVRLWLLDYHRRRSAAAEAAPEDALPIDCLPVPSLGLIARMLSTR